MTRARRYAAVAALALGGFALGLTEFVVMGLLPEIARGLLPGDYARSAPDALAHTGWLITAYASGVVVGAPTIAALTARVPRRRLVLGLLVLFVVATLASAAAPTFGLALVARFVAGLPHGAYFGAAGIVAASLIGPGSQAKGFAAVLSGLTASNIVGVPLITWLGQVTSWRIAYLAIAGVFLLTLFAALATVPEIAAAPGGSPRVELATFRSPQVWLVVAVAAIGFAGLFSVYSYIAPVTTQIAGLSAGAVPWVLVALGIGMTAGNVLGGIAGDRDLRRAMLFGFAGIVAAVAIFGVVARTPVGLFIGAFLVGGTSLFISPSLQARLIAVAPNAQLMGAALNQSATNTANSLGAALGARVIAWGWGFLAPVWVAVALGLAGLGLAALSFRLDTKWGHRPAPTDAPEPAVASPGPR
jgi:DHA1 family inner membrane transport protein